ncbi:MAG: SMC-Scp complex subunit ScpB [Firmicutes bacterium]|nr:SMC-Scp complex subunit ScpB [Bacillota bacterium]
MSSKKSIKSAFESMLFTWGEPLDAKTAGDVFNITKQEAIEYFKELQREYEEEGRGIVIRQINQSFQFVTREENADYIRALCTPVKAKKLSQSALEVLAIVAYKQPVTKGEIEAIRGIRCDRVMEGLMKKDLVCEKGRSDAVGRPILYGTTDTFLQNFGFSSIKELPPIDDIDSVVSGAVSDEVEDGVDEFDNAQIQIEI